jgi:signal transduction histidine kinase
MSIAVADPIGTSGASRTAVPDRLARAGDRGRRAVMLSRRLTLTHLPLLLVVASLVWLAVLTVQGQRSLGMMVRELSETIEPATRAAADLQLALSTEGATTRAFLLTGSAEYTTAFHEARRSRRAALERLAQIDTVSGFDMRAALEESGATLRVADAWLDELHSGQITPAEYLTQFQAQHGRFMHVTTVVGALQQTLRAEAATHQQKIFSAHATDTWLALTGVLLGMLASLSVARLGARQRALATREHAARIAAEHAHAEANLRRKQVEHLTAARARLIRGFSHDVRNPLGAADEFLFMLEQGVMDPISPAQRTAIEKSRHNVHIALALIEDLLELAQAEAADLDVKLNAVNLCEVARGVVDDYRAQATRKALAIETEVPDAAVTVQSDAARVSQIVANLVNNAIKYTSTGGITVRVDASRARCGRQWAAIEVSDTGPGIANEHHERIFQEFERLEVAGTRGAGIGLAISRRLADLLRGEITVESEPGHGSTFTLWLPLD